MEKIKFLYRAYRYRYRKDPAEIDYLLRQLKRGDTAVDIGCHKGAYLHWMRKSVGPEGRCFAFEPQPVLFEYLSGIRKRFDYHNVHLEQTAFSVEPGVFTLHIPKSVKGSSPGATLNAVGEEARAWQHTRVETTTLDRYFFERDIQPDLIKIDVEGHEWEVLSGGSQLLKSTRPKLLLECENRHLKERRAEEIFELLQQLGYSGYFVWGKSIRPLDQFDTTLHQKVRPGRFWEADDYVNNFIFD